MGGVVHAPVYAAGCRHGRPPPGFPGGRADDEGGRLRAPTTVAGARTPARAAFRSAHKRRLIDWNPWDGVEWEVPTGEDDLRANWSWTPVRCSIMCPTCATIDPRYECFVLIQGACGAPPRRGADVRRRDIDLEVNAGNRDRPGPHSELPERFFTEGETRQRPLKGRGRRTTRKIPIPAPFVSRLRLTWSSSSSASRTRSCSRPPQAGGSTRRTTVQVCGGTRWSCI